MSTNNIFRSLEEARANPQSGRGDSAWSIHELVSPNGETTLYVWSGSAVCAKGEVMDAMGWGCRKIGKKDASAAALAAAHAEKDKLAADLAAMKRAYEELLAKNS